MKLCLCMDFSLKSMWKIFPISSKVQCLDFLRPTLGDAGEDTPSVTQLAPTSQQSACWAQHFSVSFFVSSSLWSLLIYTCLCSIYGKWKKRDTENNDSFSWWHSPCTGFLKVNSDNNGNYSSILGGSGEVLGKLVYSICYNSSSRGSLETWSNFSSFLPARKS